MARAPTHAMITSMGTSMGALMLAAVMACGCAGTRSTCTINSDCHSGAHCIAGVCQTDCRADYDCHTGHCEIATGRCLAIDGDGGGPDPSPPPDAGVTAMPDLTMPDPITPPDMTTPTPTGRYGDVCAAAADCLTTVCSHDPFTSDRECTRACNGDPDCMFADLCVTALKQCAQSDIGNSCTGAMDCRMGACLGGGQAGPMICTRTCTSAAQCPAGYSCSVVNGARVCVNVDATQSCAGGTRCFYGTTCDGTRCLGSCRSVADCPLWHTCTGGLCTPNLALGRGGIGDRCFSGDDCRAGFCARGTCVGACAVTTDKGQWCPGGWGCNPIDTGGAGWTLGCLPGGNGELGSACQDNTACGTGLCAGSPGVCTRFCNSAPCPSIMPNCVAAGVVADGVNLKVCSN